MVSPLFPYDNALFIIIHFYYSKRALYLRRYYIYLRGNHYIKLEGCPLKIKVNKRIRDIAD